MNNNILMLMSFLLFTACIIIELSHAKGMEENYNNETVNMGSN